MQTLKVNRLVFLYQEHDHSEALEQLWDFYFTLVKEILLFQVINFSVEDFTEDLLNDCWVIFRQGVVSYDLTNYCFSSYIKDYMNKELTKVIIKEYLCYN